MDVIQMQAMSDELEKIARSGNVVRQLERLSHKGNNAYALHRNAARREGRDAAARLSEAWSRPFAHGDIAAGGAHKAKATHELRKLRRGSRTVSLHSRKPFPNPGGAPPSPNLGFMGEVKAALHTGKLKATQRKVLDRDGRYGRVMSQKDGKDFVQYYKGEAPK